MGMNTLSSFVFVFIQQYNAHFVLSFHEDDCSPRPRIWSCFQVSLFTPVIAPWKFLKRNYMHAFVLTW